ncbi:MAG: ornithine carbamoyltransferase [Chitinivibrionales bacterium]|nr:ornithine carbamoyltransferase [Chitinivibrionales bacterium]
MPINLRGRSLLTLKDYSPSEIQYLLELASELKRMKKAGVKPQRLLGKNIALIFEKPSTRTRCAFVVAASDEGAHPEYLGKSDIMIGKKESVKDTARVLGRMFDGIEFRGFKHSVVEELAQHAGVPVWNGLTDLDHPTQALADLLTIQEHKGRLKGLTVTYVGDGRNNVANALLTAASKMGMHYRTVTPKQLYPESELLKQAQTWAQQSGGSVKVTDSIPEGVNGSDVIYTDVWVSMGEEALFAERINLLKPYQVTMQMLTLAGPEVIFMHCLPSFHNRETDIGEEIFKKYGIGEMEVTDEAFESRHSVVFDEAENRVHTIKSVMVATLGM